ncbi:MAG: hypoxanthine phosphoribosyltransferase [Gammaproteobacteria bacterium]|nr:hypoxanthine phosphoribosyltransferase [Gammaproteobacteria bacterium]
MVGNSTITKIIDESEIEKRVAKLATDISNEYRNAGELVLVGVLKGAFILLSDLSRRLTIPHTIDFIALSSYDQKDESSGQVRLVMDMREAIEGKHVIVVEDIIDTGRTLHYLLELLNSRHPASLRTCVLVRKERDQTHSIEIDYLGFDIPDKWVVGYGLDYDEKHRTLPFIGQLN